MAKRLTPHHEDPTVNLISNNTAENYKNGDHKS
nr:MAG TPA: hypothetical protein [Caudoviricetes sp.]